MEGRVDQLVFIGKVFHKLMIGISSAKANANFTIQPFEDYPPIQEGTDLNRPAINFLPDGDCDENQIVD